MPKNLLIGAITNYVWDDVAPFFNSYLQAGFENCDCVMFTGNMSERTLEKLRTCGVITIDIPERFNDACVNDFRWELFRDYISECEEKYNIVFTADVRDTIFQRDVCRLCDDTKAFLGIALEDGVLTEKINKKWLIDRYGESVYESVKNNRIICTGTVWGTRHEFLVFASAMSKHINSTEYPYFRVCDQASGNWLIYYAKMFADVVIYSTNQYGLVMTIGLSDTKDIHADSQGFILNGKGEIAAVAHQYDRKPEIVNIVIKKYAPEVGFFSNLNASRYRGTYGRILRFITKARLRGFVPTLKETIKRRIC